MVKRWPSKPETVGSRPIYLSSKITTYIADASACGFESRHPLQREKDMNWIEILNLASGSLLIAMAIIAYQTVHLIVFGRINSSITLTRILLLSVLTAGFLFTCSLYGLKLQKGEQVQMYTTHTGR